MQEGPEWTERVNVAKTYRFVYHVVAQITRRLRSVAFPLGAANLDNFTCTLNEIHGCRFR